MTAHIIIASRSEKYPGNYDMFIGAKWVSSHVHGSLDGPDFCLDNLEIMDDGLTNIATVSAGAIKFTRVDTTQQVRDMVGPLIDY